MNLLYYAPTLRGGGAERISFEILSFLHRSSRLNLFIACNSDINTSLLPSITVFNLNAKRTSSAIFPLIKLLRSNSFDLVFTTLPDAAAVINCALYLAGISLDRHIFRIPNTLKQPLYVQQRRKRYKCLLIQKLAFKTPNLICVSYGIFKEIDYNAELKNKNIITITNPYVRKSDGAGKRLLLKPGFIFAAGRLESQKNFGFMIDAYELYHIACIKLNIEPKELVIAGHGKLMTQLKEQSESKNIANSIKLIGFVDNIEYLYKDASIFALSSLYEGFPNVLIEAICNGCRVVAHDCEHGPSEIIDSFNGTLVTTLSIHEFSNALLHEHLNILQYTDSNRKTIAKKYLDKYSVAKKADIYYNFMTSTCQKSRIILLGNFASKKINGQTIKTNYVLEALRDNKIMTLDTSHGSFWQLVSVILFITSDSTKVAICGKKALQMLCLAKALLKKLHLDGRSRSKKIFIAPGSWLPAFLQERNLYTTSFRELFDITLCESTSMRECLRQLNISSDLISNPRPSPCEIGIEIPDGSIKAAQIYKEHKIKLAFISRVSSEKGIMRLEYLINECMESLPDYEIIIDVYGPIQSNFKKVFKKLLSRCPLIRYKGTLAELSDVYRTLCRYHFSILPTSYPGECLPGTVVESLMCGVPVIISDWNANKEYINQSNGFLANLDSFHIDVSRFFQNLVKNSMSYEQLCIGALEESKKYSCSTFKSVLFNYVSYKSI